MLQDTRDRRDAAQVVQVARRLPANDRPTAASLAIEAAWRGALDPDLLRSLLAELVPPLPPGVDQQAWDPRMRWRRRAPKHVLEEFRKKSLASVPENVQPSWAELAAAATAVSALELSAVEEGRAVHDRATGVVLELLEREYYGAAPASAMNAVLPGLDRAQRSKLLARLKRRAAKTADAHELNSILATILILDPELTQLDARTSAAYFGRTIQAGFWPTTPAVAALYRRLPSAEQPRAFAALLDSTIRRPWANPESYRVVTQAMSPPAVDEAARRVLDRLRQKSAYEMRTHLLIALEGLRPFVGRPEPASEVLQVLHDEAVKPSGWFALDVLCDELNGRRHASARELDQALYAALAWITSTVAVGSDAASYWPGPPHAQVRETVDRLAALIVPVGERTGQDVAVEIFAALERSRSPRCELVAALAADGRFEAFALRVLEWPTCTPAARDMLAEALAARSGTPENRLGFRAAGAFHVDRLQLEEWAKRRSH